MRLFEFNLYEYDESSTLSNYGQKIEDRLKLDHSAGSVGIDISASNQPMQVLKYFETVDPTKKNIFVLPMARWYATGQMRMLEDASKIISPAELYVKFKNRLSGINLKTISFNEFLDIEDQLSDVQSKKESSKTEEESFFDNGSADLFYNDSSVKIIIPKTQEAAMYFGRNTKWCTAGKNNNKFNFYASKGPLYIILFKKENKRWQFQFETSQFMDEQDNELPNDEIKPILEKYFKSILAKSGKDVDVMLNRSEIFKIIQQYLESTPGDPTIISRHIGRMPKDTLLKVIKDDIETNDENYKITGWVLGPFFSKYTKNEMLSFYHQLINSLTSQETINDAFNEFSERVRLGQVNPAVTKELKKLTDQRLREIS